MFLLAPKKEKSWLVARCKYVGRYFCFTMHYRVYCYFLAYKPLQNGHIDILFIVLQGSAHHEKHTFAIFLGVNPDQTYLNQAFLNSVSVNSLSIIFSNLYLYTCSYHWLISISCQSDHQALSQEYHDLSGNSQNGKVGN